MESLKMKRVTLKDIAQLADCSPSVVSIVLNRSHGNIVVSEKMRNKIKQIAQQLQYRPNFASRSLKMDCVKTLGVCVPPGPTRYVGNIYERAIFRGIDRAAQECQYDLMLLNTGSVNPADYVLEKLGEKRIDGIVFLHLTEKDTWIERLQPFYKQVIAIDYPGCRPWLATIDFDNAMAIRLALDYLRKRGHQRIGFIGKSYSDTQIDTPLRVQAFCEIVKAFHLDDDPALVYHFNKPVGTLPPDENVCRTEGREGALALLRLPQPPTAVIAYNDLAAVGVLDAGRGCGLHIPRDLSVVGIDNNDFCDMTYPALTSVAHPLEEIGYHGTLRLLAQLRNDEYVWPQDALIPKIVERESVCPMKASPARMTNRAGEVQVKYRVHSNKI